MAQQIHADTTDAQPQTYDRLTYDAVAEGFTDGDRVTLRYESPYSGTTVEVEGFAQEVSATMFLLELDDGREWGVFENSIRTTENSRRASGRDRPANGRPVGYVDEFTVHAGDA